MDGADNTTNNTNETNGGIGASPRTQAKYESQLSREYQTDDFSGIETLDSLYKQYKSYKDIADKNSNAVAIPTKDSTPEQVAEFYKKVGRPDSEEGYNLSDYEFTPDQIGESKKAFMKEAFRNGLSQNQATNMWKNEIASREADKKKEEDLRAKAVEEYPQRADAYMRDLYPDETKRKARIETENNLFKEFASKSGIGTLLSESGLSSKPEFVHALATWYEPYASNPPTTQRPGDAGKITGLAALYSKM